MKIYPKLEDIIEVLEHAVKARDRLDLSSKSTTIIGVSESLDEAVREIKETVRVQLHQLEGISRAVTPRREALQIISGLGIDILDEISVLRHHIQGFQSQSQLNKGLTQILDISSEIDYATDSVKTLLRLTRRMLAQLKRLEVLTN